MIQVSLRLDEEVHTELWRRKEAERTRQGRKVLPWEEYVTKAIRAYDPGKGRKP